MSGAVITIECLVCQEKLTTGRADAVIAFDREHEALHVALVWGSDVRVPANPRP